MQEYPLHVFVLVGVAVPMVMTVPMSMIVSVVVSVPVMGVAKCCETNNVDQETEDTDNKELVQPL